MAVDVYQMVTDRIIANMESGEIPWRKPWGGANNLAISRSTGRPYSLLNQFVLGKPGEWLTFGEVKKAGGKVKKGEKSRIVVFWKWLEVEDKDKDGNPTKRKVPFLRYYNVFHIGQCEGIAPKYCTEEDKRTDAEKIEAGEAIIDHYISSGNAPKFKPQLSNKAYYSPTFDWVVVPQINQYQCANEYYSTAFHELTHSTMKKSRCDRESECGVRNAAFGSSDYSKEELIAEMGSAYLMNVSGLEIPQTFNNSTAYLQSWLSALRNDKKLIVSAAGKAEKAAKFILGITEQ